MRAAYVIILFVCSTCAATAADYILEPEGMHGLKIFCRDEHELAVVQLFQDVPGFDFMKVPRVLSDSVDVLVEGDKAHLFRSLLKTRNIRFQVFTEDFSELIRSEATKQTQMALRRRIEDYDFKYFPRHNEMNDYLSNLASTYGHLVTLFNIGKSYEGREMKGVKISSGGRKDKPAVFIDAGIHAREWIAPTTALYAISELLQPYNKHLLEDVDFHVIPSINPDGYEYSHTRYRLWRKTRSWHQSGCSGADPNRNFGDHWNTIGASSDPCSDIYAGQKAFSEVETRNVRDYLLSLNGTVKVYLTLHSYGQYMLHPWGYTAKLPPNEPTLRKVGSEAAKAIWNVRGTKYAVGSSTILLYAAAGGSDDWAMTEARANLSYTIELPAGRGGFVIDASEIVPVGKETFEAIKVFANYAKTCKEPEETPEESDESNEWPWDMFPESQYFESFKKLQ